jgi:hypothetical protein
MADEKGLLISEATARLLARKIGQKNPHVPEPPRHDFRETSDVSTFKNVSNETIPAYSVLMPVGVIEIGGKPVVEVSKFDGSVQDGFLFSSGRDVDYEEFGKIQKTRLVRVAYSDGDGQGGYSPEVGSWKLKQYGDYVQGIEAVLDADTDQLFGVVQRQEFLTMRFGSSHPPVKQGDVVRISGWTPGDNAKWSAFSGFKNTTTSVDRNRIVVERNEPAPFEPTRVKDSGLVQLFALIRDAAHTHLTFPNGTNTTAGAEPFLNMVSSHGGAFVIVATNDSGLTQPAGYPRYANCLARYDVDFQDEVNYSVVGFNKDSGDVYRLRFDRVGSVGGIGTDIGTPSGFAAGNEIRRVQFDDAGMYPDYWIEVSIYGSIDRTPDNEDSPFFYQEPFGVSGDEVLANYKYGERQLNFVAKRTHHASGIQTIKTVIQTIEKKLSWSVADKVTFSLTLNFEWLFTASDIFIEVDASSSDKDFLDFDSMLLGGCVRVRKKGSPVTFANTGHTTRTAATWTPPAYPIERQP